MTDTVIQGDALEVLKTLPDKSINCCVTSPPYYGLRDYGTGEWVGGDQNCDHSSAIYSKPNLRPRKQTSNVGTLIERTLKVCPVCGAKRVDKQIGIEDTPEEFIQRLVDVFHEVKRVLKDDGTLWVNIGDSYSNKNLVGIPWELAFALRRDGWYLRQDIIWHKPNPMPESVKDRFTKSHEYIFMLSKKPQYYFDHEAVQEESKWYGQDKRAGQGRIAYDGKRTAGEDNKAQQSFVSITDKRNKRDVREVSESKYADTEQEAEMRQGISRDRGNNLVILRKNLPTQEEFVEYMRSVTDAEILEQETDIKRTTIDHWFRKDRSGFSYPSLEDWLKIREYVDDWSETFVAIDEKMTDVTIETDAVGKNNDGLRNKRDVWSVNTKPVREAHFATYPEELIEPCILAGCPIGGVVLDPFFGSGTTGRVANKLNRHYIGIELNPEYISISEKRTDNVQMTLEGFM